MYIVQSIHIWERVQDEKKQERQKYPAGARQTDGKNWGLVWGNRKKISQIIKDYFYLQFFLVIILCFILLQIEDRLLHRIEQYSAWRYTVQYVRERLNGFLRPGDGTNILHGSLTADVIQGD
jgi:hypothetical protein